MYPSALRLSVLSSFLKSLFSFTVILDLSICRISSTRFVRRLTSSSDNLYSYLLLLADLSDLLFPGFTVTAVAALSDNITKYAIIINFFIFLLFKLIIKSLKKL
jgi:hypothetical protein